jgi:hypothetical protein
MYSSKLKSSLSSAFLEALLSTKENRSSSKLLAAAGFELRLNESSSILAVTGFLSVFVESFFKTSSSLRKIKKAVNKDYSFKLKSRESFL